MVKSIGIETEGRKCVECSAPFEGDEFIAYFMKFRGNSVICLSCRKKTYIVPKMSVVYVIMKLISFFVGLAVFLSIFLIIPMSTYSAESGSFVVSGLFFFMGAAAGFLIGTNIMRLYNWKTGTLTDDSLYQSYWDM